MKKYFLTQEFNDGVLVSTTLTTPKVSVNEITFTPTGETAGTFNLDIEHSDLPMLDKLQGQVKIDGEWIDSPTMSAFDKSISHIHEESDIDAGTYTFRLKSLATGVVSNELEVLVNFN